MRQTAKDGMGYDEQGRGRAGIWWQPCWSEPDVVHPRRITLLPEYRQAGR